MDITSPWVNTCPWSLFYSFIVNFEQVFTQTGFTQKQTCICIADFEIISSLATSEWYGINKTIPSDLSIFHEKKNDGISGNIFDVCTQQVFTFSKLIIETREQVVKYVQS